jgi:ribosome recycling factor
MSKDIVLKELTEKMTKAVSVLENDLKGLRTGRASSNFLDPVMAEAYGDRMPITQLSTIAVQDSKTLVVQVWDKSMVKAVEKAIVDANLGLTPNTDGQNIRLMVPALNEERRKEFVKIAYKYGESTKIAIRNVRREGIETVKKLEKNHHISQDDQKSIEKEIQNLTDSFTSKVDLAVKDKEKEILVL